MKLFVLIAVAASPFLAAPAAAASAPVEPAQRYLDCVVQKHPGIVRELLQASSREAANKPYRSLTDDDRCLGIVFRNQQYEPQTVMLPMDVLRGKLAEQTLLASAAQVGALSALPLQQKRYIRPWFAATGRDPSVDEMGACIADTDPTNILALVRTEPNSYAEGQALGAISPVLGKCLSAGTRLEAGRGALRAALAEALYQRLNNPALSTVPAQETPK
jgi:hypothetical protein